MMASNTFDMGLDDIIKMNRKAGRKQSKNQTGQIENPPKRRARTGVKASYKLRTQIGGKKGRSRNSTAGNRAQTLWQNSGVRRAQQSVKEVRARQAANRAEILNRRRKIERLEPVPTTSKTPLAPQGILQSDIVTYELEKKRIVAAVKAEAAMMKQVSQPASFQATDNPRKRLDRSKFGGVAAATLQLSLNNSDNNNRSNARRNRRGRVQVNPAVKGQVTQIQGQITKLQDKLSNIQKRQLFQIQAQGKANRRRPVSSNQRNNQRAADPTVTIRQRVGRPNNKNVQSNLRRRIIL